MLIDVREDRSMISTLRRGGGRGPWLRVLSQVLELAGARAEFMRHAERPWASATFSGTRHTIALTFSGVEGVQAGEALIVALPEHEFSVPGHIVADATISAVEHTNAEPRLNVECELLLLKED